MSLSFVPSVALDEARAEPSAGFGDATSVARAYHERTKHLVGKYARGPETLDWDAVPAPFRRFEGAPLVRLERGRGDELWSTPAQRTAKGRRTTRSVPLSVATLGVLFEHALGITAYKSQGPDRWIVRANPSSGNLHPVEGYLLGFGIDGLSDGVHHYQAEDHALARRATWSRVVANEPPRAFIALTTIPWREAWKYGERAFRYCELDTGHAIGAVEHAANLFGWRVREQTQVGWHTLTEALGIGRVHEPASVRNPDTEREEAEVLLELEVGAPLAPIEPALLARLAASAEFAGRATRIDPHPMYAWPQILDVTRATRWPDGSRARAAAVPAVAPVPVASTPRAAAAILRGRRSAQRFDASFVLDTSAFGQLLRALGGHRHESYEASEPAPAIDAVLFVHRVRSLAPGVYLCPSQGGKEAPLATRLGERFPLRRRRAKARGESDAFELFELATAPPRELMRATRMLHCHQEIAATCAFAVALVADFESALTRGPDAYRRLMREAGRIGQTLYLTAEANAVRGTGIGCFFDDAVLEFIGLAGTSFRSLYHFAIGKPIDDPRVETLRIDGDGA
jgi:SagB-type dehydrogenase family enzyme